MTDLSTAYTAACPLYARAQRLGARSGEALEVIGKWQVPPAKADRIMLWVSIASGVFVALWAFGGGAG